MKRVSSATNDLIKKAALLEHKKFRDEYGLFALEGSRAISAAFAAPAFAAPALAVPMPEVPALELETLFCSDSTAAFAAQYRVEDRTVIIPPRLFKKIAHHTTPSELLALFRIPAPRPLSELSAGLVLCQVGDPGNVGTLIRTAVACAVPTIVAIDGADPYSPKAAQASAGTVAHARMIQCSWEQLRTAAREKNIVLSALSAQSQKSIFDRTDTDVRRLFVIGNEAHGIPDSWLHDCDEQLSLPMKGSVESFNAAVAGSIALYLEYVATPLIPHTDTPKLPRQKCRNDTGTHTRKGPV